LLIGVLFAVFVLIALALGAQWYRAQDRQLSIEPPRSFSKIQLQPVDSKLGLQARLRYDHLQRAAEAASLEPYRGEGRKRGCDRVLGKKVCATAVWNYTIRRTGPIAISNNKDRVRLTLPLQFDGIVSVEGRAAKLLGLRNKDLTGALEVSADIGLDVDDQWCPVVDSSLSYRWLSEPRLRVLGRMKINLRKSVDRALEKQLPALSQRLAQTIDCDTFLQRLNDQWKTHLIPIRLPGEDETLLKIVPTGLAFSGSVAKSDHLSFSLSVDATTETLSGEAAMTARKTPQSPQDLPRRSNEQAEPGTVEFNLLLRLSYEALTSLLTEKVVGKRFDTAAGAQLTVKAIELYPSAERLIFKLDFTARAATSWFDSNGTLYLSARPMAGKDGRSLHFDDIHLTRVIDSELWRLLSTLLNDQILQAVERESRMDLSDSITRLEDNIATTLANPDKTGGIAITARPPQVRLTAVNVEQHTMAAIIHVSSRLQASIPEDMLLPR
jgi:hypothetical protein